MGICISTASSEIHNIEYGPDNLVYYEDESHAAHANKGLASLHTHQGSKGPNQDSGILYQGYEMEDGALCAVFDGHGTNGHIVSNFVRNRLPSLLLNQKSSLSKFNNTTCTPNDDRNCSTGEMVPSKNFYEWKDACVSAFKLLDKEVKLLENVDCSCSGTTAVVVVRQGEDLVIANLGDSRALLGTTNENGVMAVQLTNDLKPCVPTEADRIRKCNGRVLALQNEAHIQRVWLPHHDSPGLAMSRAFGDFLLKNHGVIAIPDVFYRRLTSNDQFLVLATDGVWDVLSNSEVASIVWAAKTEAAAANAVVETAAAAWKQKFSNSRRDDCTVICLFLQKRHHHYAQPNALSF